MRCWTIWILLVIVGITAYCRAAGEVVVEGEWSGSGGFFGTKDLRRLVAWRQGDLYFSPSQDDMHGHLYLHIKRVISGEMLDDLYQQDGEVSIYVTVLNDASFAINNYGKDEITGTWRLSPMPDGGYAVFTLDDVPEQTRESGLKAKQSMQALVVQLTGKDPNATAEALGRCADSGYYYYHLFPTILALADSTVKVKMPATLADSEDAPGMSTLGRVAQRTLTRLASSLENSTDTSDMRTTAKWQAWWKGVLATPAFPVLKFATGAVYEIGRLTEYWPEVYLSPDGRQGLAAYQWQEKVLDGKHRGVRVYDIQHPGINRVLWGAVGNRNAPILNAVAWDLTRMAIIHLDWKGVGETGRTLRFITTDRNGTLLSPVADLGLFGAETLALCSFGDGWLIAMIKLTREIWVQRLSAHGERQGEPVKLALPLPVSKTNRHSMPMLSITDTAAGPALSCLLSRNNDYIMHLVLLNPDLTVRKVVNVQGESSSVQIDPYGAAICANGDTLAVVSTGPLWDTRACVIRTFDLQGNARGPLVRVASDVIATSSPAPCGSGFTLAYSAYVETPDQAYVAVIARDGKLISSCLAYAGSRNRGITPLAVGVHDTTAVLMLLDHARYPFPIMVKECELQGVQ